MVLEVGRYWKWIIFGGGGVNEPQCYTFLQLISKRWTLLTVFTDRKEQIDHEKFEEKTVDYFNASWPRIQKTSIMKTWLLPKRSDLFQNTLMFKQQSTEAQQHAQGKYMKNNKNTPPTHPTPIFNSKVRYSGCLFNFLKQNNKILASTSSNIMLSIL